MKYSFGPYEVRKVLSTRRLIIKFLSTKSVFVPLVKMSYQNLPIKTWTSTYT